MIFIDFDVSFFSSWFPKNCHQKGQQSVISRMASERERSSSIAVAIGEDLMTIAISFAGLPGKTSNQTSLWNKGKAGCCKAPQPRIAKKGVSESSNQICLDLLTMVIQSQPKVALRWRWLKANIKGRGPPKKGTCMEFIGILEFAKAWPAWISFRLELSLEELSAGGFFDGHRAFQLPILPGTKHFGAITPRHSAGLNGVATHWCLGLQNRLENASS